MWPKLELEIRNMKTEVPGTSESARTEKDMLTELVDLAIASFQRAPLLMSSSDIHVQRPEPHPRASL